MALGQDLFWSLLNNPAVRGGISDSDLLVEARSGYDDFFGAMERLRPGRPGSHGRPPRWALEGELQAGLGLWDTLNRIQRAIINAPQMDDGDRETAVMQVEEIAATVRALSLPEPETHIRLCEVTDEPLTGTEGTFQALYRPLEVTNPLQRMLFDVWPRVICTSATLSVNNDLGWFKRQIGLPSNGEGPVGLAGEGPSVLSKAIPGPFDYRRQMLLYTPRTLMPVYDERAQSFANDYVQQLTEEVGRLIETSRGRALVLYQPPADDPALRHARAGPACTVSLLSSGRLSPARPRITLPAGWQRCFVCDAWLLGRTGYPRQRAGPGDPRQDPVHPTR